MKDFHGITIKDFTLTKTGSGAYYYYVSWHDSPDGMHVCLPTVEGPFHSKRAAELGMQKQIGDRAESVVACYDFNGREVK